MRRLARSLCLVALACAQVPAAPAPPPIDPARIRAEVSWLADDAREGRGLATAGLAEATRYLAEGFAEAGLEPAGPDGSYLQRFETPVAIAIERASLAVGRRRFERGSDFEALLTSRSGAALGDLVFAGYGISDEASGWDDYAGVDAAGALVLVLDERPQLETGPLGGAEGARFLRRAYKIANAHRHGAAAILLAPAAQVPGLPANAGREDANPSQQESAILALALSREAAAAALEAAGGADLSELQQAILAAAAPRSRRFAGVRARAEVEIGRELRTLANVVGLRRGADPARASEAVVIGAHFDHLGRGEYGSLAPDRRGEVHNGADDNASGAAGLLALARALGARPPPARTVVLAGFTAEEVGLAGSARYVEDPPLPLADTVAMLNLDMIGRLEPGEALTVFGAESSPEFERLVLEEAQHVPLEVAFTEGAFAPSDQTSFHARGVPVLFFFSGTHPEYHTPDDDAPRVDAEGLARVVELVERVALRLAEARERPVLVQAPAPARTSGEAGYGPYLGTVPAFGGAPVRGVRLQGVRAGSPAEQAGLRAGDVIVEFDDAPVANLEEFAALLFGSRAGERVEMVVERDGTRLEVWAVLGQRR
jgi:hypothetical protein